VVRVHYDVHGENGENDDGHVHYGVYYDVRDGHDEHGEHGVFHAYGDALFYGA